MNKITKILLLAVSALLLIGATFGIGAMATGGAEEPAHKVEILFNNLEYGDKIGILYGVQVDGGNTAVDASEIKMNFYIKKDGATDYTSAGSKTGEKATIKVNGEDKAVYTLTSPGLAPKYMTKVIYAQAVVTIDEIEYKSEMSSFSIAEYCYKRLYKDTDTTSAQRELYESVLAFGKNVQIVLPYDADNTPDTYCYVNAKDTGIVVNSATINGNEETFDTGIVKNGTTLTLPEFSGTVPEGQKFAGYKVTKNGVEESDTLAAGATVTINNHTIITPDFKTIRGDGYYYTNGGDANAKIWNMEDATLKNNYREYGANAGVTLSTVDDGGNKALFIDRTSGLDTKVSYLTWRNYGENETGYAGETLPDGHIAVFEFDVKFSNMTADTPRSWRMNMMTGSTTAGRYGTIYFGTDANGKIRLNNNGGNHTFRLEQDTWYNLRFEVDNATGYVKVYVDNVLQTYVKDGATVDSFSPDSNAANKNGRMELQFNSNGNTTEACDLYIDNLFLGGYTPTASTEAE